MRKAFWLFPRVYSVIIDMNEWRGPPKNWAIAHKIRNIAQALHNFVIDPVSVRNAGYQRKKHCIHSRSGWVGTSSPGGVE